MEEEKLKTSNPKGAGRKWFDGKDEKSIVAKLEYTASLDASIEECLFYADISVHSYYRYIKVHPDFAIKLEKLRQKPVLKARQAVNEKMGENFNNAMDYLKRKKRKEFADNVDLTSDGEKIEGVSVTIVHETGTKGDNGVREDIPEQSKDNLQSGGNGEQ